MGTEKGRRKMNVAGTGHILHGLRRTAEFLCIDIARREYFMVFKDSFFTNILLCCVFSFLSIIPYCVTKALFGSYVSQFWQMEL